VPHVKTSFSFYVCQDCFSVDLGRVVVLNPLQYEAVQG